MLFLASWSDYTTIHQGILPGWSQEKVMTLIPKQITHYSYPTPLWYSGYMSDLSSAGRWFERTTNATHFLVETMSEGWV